MRGLAVLTAALLVAAGAASRHGAAQDPCRLTPVSRKPPTAYLGRLSSHWLKSGKLWMGYTRGDDAFVVDPTGQKIAWYRETRGRLRVTGERLVGDAPPLEADVPDGYGTTGFQASGLTFSSPGCWEVVANVGGYGPYRFVVRVVAKS